MELEQRQADHGASVSLVPALIFGAVCILLGLGLAFIVPMLNILPPTASVQAQRVDNLFLVLMGLGGMVFFLVQILIYYAAIRFRVKPNDVSDGAPIHGNATLEIIWTAIPSVIVVALAAASWWIWNQNTMVADVTNVINGDEIPVNAIGQRFAWTFEYNTPELNIDDEPITLTSNELHVYIGQDVYLDMTTRDVIHSFWVPAMRVKQDLLPGRTTPITFTPIDAGDGWEFVNAYSPVTVYAEADDASDIIYSVESQLNADGEGFEDTIQFELVDQDNPYDEDSWVQIVTPDGDTGYIDSNALTGRYKRYRLICTELCGGGHGNMYSWLVLHESEEALLDNWYTQEVAKRVEPPSDPYALGEQVLSSGQYPCSNCHVLDSLEGWNGNIGPNLNGLGSRSAERASLTDAVNGADYIAQSIRRPNAYIVPPYAAGVMNYFGSTVDAPAGVNGHIYMPQDHLNGIVAYLCAETESGNLADSTCGLDAYADGLDAVDVDALVTQLFEITDKYEE